MLILVCSICVNRKLRLKDEFGRSRIFHGVNVVYKVSPYIPITDKFDPFLSLSKEDISYFKKFGFTLVRLGIMWESIETAYQQYDMELLQKFTDLVNELGRNGIYTIIDAHQDVLTRKFCGEGIPSFYINDLSYEKTCDGNLLKRFMHFLGVCKSIDEYNFRKNEQGNPLLEDCHGHFVDLFNSPELTSVYDSLYFNKQGLRDNYTNFWKVIAKQFKGNKYVLGFDLWNEPFPGNMYKKFWEYFPGRADNDQVLEFYRAVDKGIREVDPDYVLMFEPCNVTDFPEFGHWMLPWTFTEAPLKEDNSRNQMFNFHSYCCSLGNDVCKGGEPDISMSEKCREYHFNKFKVADEYSKTHSMDQIITEFGACLDTQSCFNEISAVADAADQSLTSWAYWMYKPYKDFTTTCPDDREGLFYKDGSVQPFKVKALTRSYVVAFQGEPLSMFFDTETKVLQAEMSYDSSIKRATVIYLNKELNYPNGFNLEVKGTGKYFEIESEENYIEILIEDYEAELVSFSITPS